VELLRESARTFILDGETEAKKSFQVIDGMHRVTALLEGKGRFGYKYAARIYDQDTPDQVIVAFANGANEAANSVVKTNLGDFLYSSTDVWRLSNQVKLSKPNQEASCKLKTFLSSFQFLPPTLRLLNIFQCIATCTRPLGRS